MVSLKDLQIRALCSKILEQKIRYLQGSPAGRGYLCLAVAICSGRGYLFLFAKNVKNFMSSCTVCERKGRDVQEGISTKKLNRFKKRCSSMEIYMSTTNIQNIIKIC